MKTQLTKEQLQKQLKEIAKQERKALIEKHYPEFKQYEGRFFKTRNHYSCPEKPSDYWWYYTKVTEITPEDVYDTLGNGAACHFKGWSFEDTKGGDVFISKNKQGYIHSLGKEITEAEFNEAWNKMVDSFEKLR